MVRRRVVADDDDGRQNEEDHRDARIKTEVGRSNPAHTVGHMVSLVRGQKKRGDLLCVCVQGFVKGRRVLVQTLQYPFGRHEGLCFLRSEGRR